MAGIVIPVGTNRGDGITVLPVQPVGQSGVPTVFGTPIPAGDLSVSSNAGNYSIEEKKDSPTFERAEQATVQHSLSLVSYENGLSYMDWLGRGQFVKDTYGNVWRILSSSLKKDFLGNAATLSYTAESISFDSPPDEFNDQPVELGIDIIKHPRYSWALTPVANDQTTSATVGDTEISYTSVKSTIIRMIQTYRDSPVFPSADQINGLFHDQIIGQIHSGKIDIQVPVDGYDPDITLDPPPRWNGVIDDLPDGNYASAIVSVPVNLANPADPIAIAIAAAKEIISKIWRQEDTPYITGRQVTWTQYFFRPVYLNPGGYIENPVGIIPDYFMSPDQDGTSTVYDQFAFLNPQSYADTGLSDGNVDISWLRKADEVQYERTWFKITRTWIGSPIGHWDADLYTQGPRPQIATDFDQLI